VQLLEAHPPAKMEFKNVVFKYDLAIILIDDRVADPWIH
jgi:hypothetical protein